MSNISHRPKKHLGQHFLTDEGVIQNIVSVISPQKNQHLVEIGPGLGALTKHLLPMIEELDVIEFDKDVLPSLKKVCEPLGKLIIHLQDVLTFDFSELTSKAPLRIVGNLPYQISTPLLFHLTPFDHLIEDMHFMLQKEVVDRMAAQPGSKAYGRLSVMTQYHFDVASLFVVQKEAFNPPPKVLSAVVRLTPRKNKAYLKDYEVFANLVKQAFMQRRKTLSNSLKGICTVDQIKAIGLDPKMRAEEVSVGFFVKLSDLF